jgi:hypothetical protein
VAGDSTAIADRVPIGAGPFAHCRPVRGTAAATSSLRRRLLCGFRGRAGSTGSTTRSQPPTCSGQLIEMRLAQVEFVAGRAVVHSNRRHGLAAVTVKIAGKHDTCCLSHNTSVQRHTSDRLLGPIQTATIDPSPSQRLTTSHGSDALADKRGQGDNDLVQHTHEPQPAGRDVRSGESPQYRRATTAPRTAIPHTDDHHGTAPHSDSVPVAVTAHRSAPL